MAEDPRCCGCGTCLIDEQGRCWCGQQWDGQKMCFAPLNPVPPTLLDDGIKPTSSPATEA